MGLSCDHGPGDCKFAPEQYSAFKQGSLPDSWNPASPSRVTVHVMWTGIADGVEAGTEQCQVCFQRGKDIQVATAENVCGPLCGYSREALQAKALWGEGGRVRAAAHEAAAHLAGEPARPYLLFYGGRIHVTRGEEDKSGRAQLWAHHKERPGFRIQMSADSFTSFPVNTTFDDDMRKSVFCFVPLGHDAGDPDRYVPALLFGCVPVMLTSSVRDGKRVPLALPYEEHPAVDWAAFAVLLDLADIPRLHTILAAVTPAELRRKRHAAGRVWRRFLWTRMYGSYLGEDGEDDAFESFATVLRWRLPALGLATEGELHAQEEVAAQHHRATRLPVAPVLVSRGYDGNGD